MASLTICILRKKIELSTLHHAEVSICYIYLIKSTKGKSVRLCGITIIKTLPEMTISIGQFWLKLL